MLLLLLLLLYLLLILLELLMLAWLRQRWGDSTRSGGCGRDGLRRWRG